MSTEERPGRRGRRRVVAPATSGQPEEIESQVFSSASLDAGEAAKASEQPSGEPAEGEKTADGTAPGQKNSAQKTAAERKPALSPRDRWILEQRPPHWD